MLWHATHLEYSSRLKKECTLRQKRTFEKNGKRGCSITCIIHSEARKNIDQSERNTHSLDGASFFVTKLAYLHCLRSGKKFCLKSMCMMRTCSCTYMLVKFVFVVQEMSEDYTYIVQRNVGKKNRRVASESECKQAIEQ